MADPKRREALERKVAALLDDRLIEAFFDAAAHFKTHDLVLVFNTELRHDPVTAEVREQMIQDPEIPLNLKQKLSNPPKRGDSHTAFWLIMILPDDIVVTAVNSFMLGEGGSA